MDRRLLCQSCSSLRCCPQMREAERNCGRCGCQKDRSQGGCSAPAVVHNCTSPAKGWGGYRRQPLSLGFNLQLRSPCLPSPSSRVPPSLLSSFSSAGPVFIQERQLVSAFLSGRLHGFSIVFFDSGRLKNAGQGYLETDSSFI